MIEHSRIKDQFARLVQECAAAASRWRSPLPTDPELWDPYVRVLLHGMAYQQANVDAALTNVLSRFWCELVNRINPGLLRPVVARTIVQFYQAESSILLAQGTRVDGIGRDGKQVRFTLERDFTVLPLTIVETRSSAGSFAVGLSSARGPGVSLGEACEMKVPRLSVFLYPLFAKTGTMAGPGQTPSVVPTILRNGSFVPLSDASICWQADSCGSNDGPLTLFAEEQYLANLTLPADLCPESWDNSEPLYWLRFHSVGQQPEGMTSSDASAKCPIEINCALAANQYVQQKTFLLNPGQIGYVRLEHGEAADRIVSLDRVWSGQFEFRPAHLADESTYSTFIVDWLPSGAGNQDLIYNLILNIRPQDRKAFRNDSVNIDMVVTDGENASMLGPDSVTALWEKKRDRRFVTARNIVGTSAYCRQSEMYSGLADWVALYFRSRGVCKTQSDIEAMLMGKFGQYVAAVRVSPELQNSPSGHLVNGVRIAVRLRDDVILSEPDRLLLMRLIHQCVSRAQAVATHLEVEPWR